ncbi:MAG: archaellin/type IV pilin N-terminal domain-containing protein [Methanohalophilus sp.]
MPRNIKNNDKAFTGLEAAIVLIAFVVVAAVFSYVMLGAGFYTTQKSQEVVHTGVEQASSSLAPSGDVSVAAGDNGVDNVTFYVTNTAGGAPVDLNKTVVTYTDGDTFNTSGVGEVWHYHGDGVINVGDSKNLVEAGEKYKITVNTSEFTPNKPDVNDKIKIEVKPPEGAVLVIERTMPPALSDGKYYTVY